MRLFDLETKHLPILMDSLIQNNPHNQGDLEGFVKTHYTGATFSDCRYNLRTLVPCVGHLSQDKSFKSFFGRLLILTIYSTLSKNFSDISGSFPRPFWIFSLDTGLKTYLSYRNIWPEGHHCCGERWLH